jgi:hypothetical protein
MREQVHELNRIPTEFHEDGAPELPPLPDEFNRYPRRAKTEDRRSRLRRSMLLLAASGLTVLGILFPQTLYFLLLVLHADQETFPDAVLGIRTQSQRGQVHVNDAVNMLPELVNLCFSPGLLATLFDVVEVHQIL